jgi:hypothetical protein
MLLWRFSSSRLPEHSLTGSLKAHRVAPVELADHLKPTAYSVAASRQGFTNLAAS